MIIAIDGYCVTGKSTLAKILANKIGFRHINSGLLYRAISNNLLTKGIDILNFNNKLNEVRLLTTQFIIDFEHIEKNMSLLKTNKVGKLGIQIAKLPFVRDRVKEELLNAVKNSNTVIDGRDIGTVLFPNAEIKFFFVTDIDVRVKRLGKERNNINFEAMKTEIEIRDYEDITRETSPLKKAKDAIEIDTSKLTVEDTLTKLENYLHGL